MNFALKNNKMSANIPGCFDEKGSSQKRVPRFM
jgi:hypothetical protein